MPIEVGQLAPDFTLPDQFGADVTLSSFRGTKDVLLVFYPFAFTGTCTGELAAINLNLDSFEGEDRTVLVISSDTKYSQRIFAEREGYQFRLLSDFWPHGAVARDYGVFFEPRGCALRASFLVDREGVVRWSVVQGLGEARDVTAYQEAFAAL
ncbi:MAG TPA: peroxiredoxin [Actinomycetes bacterium]|nr:peroxiredoxin [Actinomycetes bacterium]